MWAIFPRDQWARLHLCLGHPTLGALSQAARGFVDALCVGEVLGDVGREEHKIGTGPIPGQVFATHATASLWFQHGFCPTDNSAQARTRRVKEVLSSRPVPKRRRARENRVSMPETPSATPVSPEGSGTELKPPEPLTLRGVLSDTFTSLAIILGTAIVEFVKHQFPDLPKSASLLLLLGEITSLVLALGYVLTALRYLWEQFSYLVESIATSKTWPRLKSAAARVAGLLAWALSWAVRIAIVILILAAVGSSLDTIFPGLLQSPLQQPLTFTEQKAGPMPVWLVLSLVFGIPAATLLIRYISFSVQNRWRGTLAP